MEADDNRRCRGEDGQSLVGLVTGVLIFLVFLLFATHLLLGLYARSVVSAAAFDGAQHLARNGGGGGGVDAAAEQTVRGQVGPGFRSMTVGHPDADHVECTVVVQAPRFLSDSWLPGAADTITRSARVRIERPR